MQDKDGERVKHGKMCTCVRPCQDMLLREQVTCNRVSTRDLLEDVESRRATGLLRVGT